MIENPEKQEGEPKLSPDQEQHLGELAEVAPPEAVEQEKLGILLTSELENLQESHAHLYEEVCRVVSPDNPASDPESLVVENLLAPSDSSRRAELIGFLSSYPNTRRIIPLLKKIEALVTEI